MYTCTPLLTLILETRLPLLLLLSFLPLLRAGMTRMLISHVSFSYCRSTTYIMTMQVPVKSKRSAPTHPPTRFIVPTSPVPSHPMSPWYKHTKQQRKVKWCATSRATIKTVRNSLLSWHEQIAWIPTMRGEQWRPITHRSATFDVLENSQTAWHKFVGKTML